jgi:hypothetical protein
MITPLYMHGKELYLGGKRISRTGGLSAHDVPIRRIGICATRLWAASSDEDGTLRVWSLEDLRVPQNPSEACDLMLRKADLLAVGAELRDLMPNFHIAALIGETLHLFRGRYGRTELQPAGLVSLAVKPSTVGTVVSLQYQFGMVSNITGALVCRDAAGNEFHVWRYASGGWRLPHNLRETYPPVYAHA